MYIRKDSDRRKEEKQAERYMQEIRAIVNARLSRRELLKMGLVVGGAGLIELSGLKAFKPYWAYAAKKPTGCLPLTRDFVEPLPIPSTMAPVTLDPLPTMERNPLNSSIN